MLKERIDILQQAGIVSKEVEYFVKLVIDKLESSFADNQSGMEMFTTHLAMATQRIISNGEVEELDDSIWKEVVSSPYYLQAKSIYNEIIKEAPCIYPQGEKRFLIMHLCNLHQK